MSNYLLEIGTEEIPASFINPSAEFLKQESIKQLSDKNLCYSNIISGGTPRRLYLYIEGLPERQPDSEVEMTGPPANIAFDENGELTKAGLGFAKSKGLDMDSLKKIETPKGEYLSGVKKTIGLDTKVVLKEIVENLIKSIPFKKSMKWGNGDFRFARPVHWLLSIFDGEVLELNLENLTASDFTFGHRFMSKGKIKIKDFNDYKTKLTDNKVIVDFEERKKIIADKLQKFSNKNNFKIDVDEELLDTVANLVEYPHPILGEFSKDFLDLPSEALITSMKYHQKYFYVTDDKGSVLNYFVGISNTVPEDDNVVKNGYERVLRARLSDAMFFYENDKKVSLDSRVEELKKVVYQVKLGTSYEKIERFSAVAKWITQNIKPEIEKNVLRSAYICKADLMTEMVYEFAELQGIMGREYALIAGEDKNVAEAILEHYLPRFAGDKLPQTDEGAIVSIADKIDTICGCFAINLIPTGNNDPYALRRSAIGIIQIIRDKNYRIDFKELINTALEQLKSKVEFDFNDTAEKVFEFIMLRYKQILSQEEVSQDAFDAVYKRFNDIITIEKAAKTLTKAKSSEEFKIISASYKRIANILKKQNWSDSEYKKELFETEEEKTLADVLEKQTAIMEQNVKDENFDNVLSALIEFAEPVDAFFENVMVMVDDEKIRNNRLCLLLSLKQSFDILGELSKVG